LDGRAGLKPTGPIGPRAVVIYSWLFKDTQKHKAGFTEKNWATHLLRPALDGLNVSGKKITSNN